MISPSMSTGKGFCWATVCCVIWLLLPASEVCSQTSDEQRPPAPDLQDKRQIVRSRSGKFVINGPGLNLARMTNAMATLQRNEVFLDAPVLAMSAERIRDAFLEEFQMRESSKKPVYIVLREPTPRALPIVVQSVQYRDGWQHRLELPEKVEREHLIKAVVSVCLLELSGAREDGGHAEIPRWLNEGLARHLYAKSMVPLVMQTELDWQQVRFFESKRMPDPYRFARVTIMARKPLDVAGLDRVGDLRTEDDWEHFRSCAQLFTGELLKLSEGPSRMAEFLRLLPGYLNWQFAFLKAFEGQFQTMLDVEKWWSVTLVSFQNRDQHMKLSMADGLMHLAQIISVPVSVRGARNSLPDAGVTTLQTLISDGSLETQRAVLPRVVQQLRALQWNVPPDLLKLIDDYRFAIESYLAKREKAGGGAGRVTIGPTVPMVVRETVQKLNLLDQLHADFATYATK